MLGPAGDEAGLLLFRRPRPPAETDATAAATAAAAAAAAARPVAARRHAMVYSAIEDDAVRTVEVYAPSA